MLSKTMFRGRGLIRSVVLVRDDEADSPAGFGQRLTDILYVIGGRTGGVRSLESGTLRVTRYARKNRGLHRPSDSSRGAVLIVVLWTLLIVGLLLLGLNRAAAVTAALGQGN